MNAVQTCRWIAIALPLAVALSSCDGAAPVPPSGVASTALTTVSVTASADTYVRSGNPNQPAGLAEFIRLQASGHNRGLVHFEQDAIVTAVGGGDLVSAALELTVSENAGNWGTSGRTVDLHRLTQAWTEAGATWNCADDSVPTNSVPNCSGATAWQMDAVGPNPWVASPSATTTITSSTAGTVSLDVTSDVAAYLTGTPNNGWILRKTDEGAAGQIEFASRETPTGPRLVLGVMPAPPDAGPDTGPDAGHDAGADAGTCPSGAGWHPVATAGAPSPRFGQRMHWTGSEVAVWGGSTSGGTPNDGALYDPSSDSWRPMTTTGAPSGRSAAGHEWTGTELFIWGGFPGAAFPATNDGALYDPATDSWRPTSASPLSPRSVVVTAMTPYGIFVWGGGVAPATYGNDGALYDPASDTWAMVSGTGAPSARGYAHGLWTGTEVLVWGGGDNDGSLGDGALYNPVTDTWRPVSSAGAASARITDAQVWTGTEMLVWGGVAGPELDDGALYAPGTDTWRSMSALGAPEARQQFSAAWSGSELYVFGGFSYQGGPHTLGDGARYTVAGDEWAALPEDGAPPQRVGSNGVWTSCGFFVWGGEVGDHVGTDTAALFVP